MKRLHQIQKIAHTLGNADEADRSLLEKFCSQFGELAPEERLALYRWLSTELEVSPENLAEPLGRLQAPMPEDPATWSRNLGDLRAAIAAPRRRALAALINRPGGMKFILELRAELLELQRNGQNEIDLLEREVADLLNDWFHQGFLFLKEINLSSSFNEIRYLKERELVHPMISLEEMGQRLGEDRLCFALYHAAMSDEPVVFIEVALSRGLLRSIHAIIDDPGTSPGLGRRADTAIFYSINNTQNGLAGLGLGKVLVYQVTEALRQRHPGLRTFATLSPIPGFWPRYLRPILSGTNGGFQLQREDVLRKIPPRTQRAILEREGGSDAKGGADAGDRNPDLAAVLLQVLSRPDWIADPFYFKSLRKPLTEIAFVYLAEETDRRGRPRNPVANFHLGNGATLSARNVNYGANRSARGLQESCGLMVNYVYAASTIQQVSQALQSWLPWGR
jgi:hypothetical protein